MRTLVVGVTTALLGFACLTLAAAPVLGDDLPGATYRGEGATASPAPSTAAPTPPAEPSIPPPADPTTPPPRETTPAPAPTVLPDPVVTITCTQIDVDVFSPPGAGLRFAAAQGRAEKGTPAFLPVSDPLSGRFLFQMVVDPGQATRWIFEVRSPDGVAVWSRSGTTVPCAAEPKFKYTAAYPVEPVVACGKTLADVHFPSTPGIVYSYDEWNAYAQLQPGWLWDYDAFSPAHSWWILGTSPPSDTAWLPRNAFLIDGRGCPRYASVPSPVSQRPGTAGWKGIGTVTVAARGPATMHNVPPQQADPGAAARQTQASDAAAAVGDAPTTSVSPSVSPRSSAAAPTPAPSPSATPTSEPQPRVTTSAGLAAAGGAVGACTLTVAGAVAFRLRHRLVPVEIEREAPADEGGSD